MLFNETQFVYIEDLSLCLIIIYLSISSFTLSSSCCCVWRSRAPRRIGIPAKPGSFVEHAILGGNGESVRRAGIAATAGSGRDAVELAAVVPRQAVVPGVADPRRKQDEGGGRHPQREEEGS